MLTDSAPSAPRTAYPGPWPHRHMRLQRMFAAVSSGGLPFEGGAPNKRLRQPCCQGSSRQQAVAADREGCSGVPASLLTRHVVRVVVLQLICRARAPGVSSLACRQRWRAAPLCSPHPPTPTPCTHPRTALTQLLLALHRQAVHLLLVGQLPSLALRQVHALRGAGRGWWWSQAGRGGWWSHEGHTRMLGSSGSTGAPASKFCLGTSPTQTSPGDCPPPPTTCTHEHINSCTQTHAHLEQVLLVLQRLLQLLQLRLLALLEVLLAGDIAGWRGGVQMGELVGWVGRWVGA